MKPTKDNSRRLDALDVQLWNLLGAGQQEKLTQLYWDKQRLKDEGR